MYLIAQYLMNDKMTNFFPSKCKGHLMNLFLSTYETHMRQEVEKAFGGTLCGQVMKQPKVCITRCVWVTRANHMIVRPVIRWVIELQTRGYKHD